MPAHSPKIEEGGSMMLFARLRRSVALFICPEIGAPAELTAKLSPGFFDPAVAREHFIERRSAPAVGKTGQAASVTDLIGGAEQERVGKGITPPIGRLSLALQSGDGLGGSAGSQLVDGRDEAEQDRLEHVDLVLEQSDLSVRHVSSPVRVGASQGKQASGPAIGETLPGRRLDDSLAGDLICVAFLFGLIPLILSLGGM
jgi:hypothetical protein